MRTFDIAFSNKKIFFNEGPIILQRTNVNSPFQFSKKQPRNEGVVPGKQDIDHNENSPGFQHRSYFP